MRLLGGVLSRFLCPMDSECECKAARKSMRPARDDDEDDHALNLWHLDAVRTYFLNEVFSFYALCDFLQFVVLLASGWELCDVSRMIAGSDHKKYADYGMIALSVLGMSFGVTGRRWIVLCPAGGVFAYMLFTNLMAFGSSETCSGQQDYLNPAYVANQAVALLLGTLQYWWYIWTSQALDRLFEGGSYRWLIMNSRKQAAAQDVSIAETGEEHCPEMKHISLVRDDGGEHGSEEDESDVEEPCPSSKAILIYDSQGGHAQVEVKFCEPSELEQVNVPGDSYHDIVNSSTCIVYYLPDTAQEAAIVFTTMNARQWAWLHPFLVAAFGEALVAGFCCGLWWLSPPLWALMLPDFLEKLVGQMASNETQREVATDNLAQDWDCLHPDKYSAGAGALISSTFILVGMAAALAILFHHLWVASRSLRMLNDMLRLHNRPNGKHQAMILHLAQ